MIVIPTLTGYFTHLEDLCKALRHGHWDSHLLTDPNHFAKLGCYKRDVLATVHAIKVPRGSNPFQHLKAAWRMRRVVEQVTPHLIHIHCGSAIMSACLAGIHRQAPTIGTVHGINSAQNWGTSHYLFLAAEWLFYRRLKAVYVLSESDLQYARERKLGGQFQTYKTPGIGCRIDQFSPERFSSQRKAQIRESLRIVHDAFVFIFVGRQVHFKGFGVAVRAFLAFHNLYQNSRLLLVGARDPQHGSGLSPEEEHLLESHAGILRVGWSEEVESYLAISHVNLFPSEREGMPVCVMESLSMGVPLITLDSRGCRDLVRHEVDGYVVSGINRCRDSTPQHFLHYMETLYLNRRKLAEFAFNALQRRADFDRQNWVREQVGIYEEILVKETSRGGGHL